MRSRSDHQPSAGVTALEVPKPLPRDHFAPLARGVLEPERLEKRIHLGHLFGPRLDDFHIDAETGQARVTIAVRIVSDQTGRVIASRIFKATAPVAGDSIDDMVDAMNAAFTTIAADIVVWTLARI